MRRRGRVQNSSRGRRMFEKLDREDQKYERLTRHRVAPKGMSVCFNLIHFRRFFVRVMDYKHAERLMSDSSRWPVSSAAVHSLGLRIDGKKG